jgi:hypothetical protein
MYNGGWRKDSWWYVLVSLPILVVASVILTATYIWMIVYLGIWYVYWWLGWTDEDPNLWRSER